MRLTLFALVWNISSRPTHHTPRVLNSKYNTRVQTSFKLSKIAALRLGILTSVLRTTERYVWTCGFKDKHLVQITRAKTRVFLCAVVWSERQKVIRTELVLTLKWSRSRSRERHNRLTVWVIDAGSTRVLKTKRELNLTQHGRVRDSYFMIMIIFIR